MKHILFVIVVTLLLINNSDAGMVGGWSDLTDVNSTQFQKIVSFVSEKISDGSNSLYHMRPLEALSARKQVVSGVKYEFTLRMAATECKKNRSDHVDLSECKLLSCGPIERCNVTVWDQPWLENGTKLMERDCEREPKSC